MAGIQLLEIAALLFAVLAGLLAGGVWIAVSLLAVGWLGMLFVGGIPAGSVLATTVWGNSASWELAALPLFIWMGEILFRTRLSEEMFRGLAPWLGWVPGRLMHVNVIASGLFGSVSGSSAATCATVAKIALPELKRRGYDEKLSLGSLAGAGTLGILIPPSITMVVYAVAANVSIIQIFLAGFIPGLLVMGLYSGYIAGWSLVNSDKMPPPEPRMSFREKLKELANLIPLTLLILLVFGVLISGWASATECAAWGVLGSLADRVVGRLAQSRRVLAERNGHDAHHLHDHADPGRRVLHEAVDGIHRHSRRARGLGRRHATRPLCADRRTDGHVHRARHRARRYLDDRADHGRGAADGAEGGLRSGLVRDFRRPDRRDGGGVAAGRLQPVRAADHERQGLPTRLRWPRFRSSFCWSLPSRSSRCFRRS